MPIDNDKRRERARAALRAVPTHYDQTEEGITDAISDLAHLAAKQGIDVDALLVRCRRKSLVRHRISRADRRGPAPTRSPARARVGPSAPR